MKYTIKSKSEEGIYYLVCGWDKHNTFWISEEDLLNNREKSCSMFFNKPGTAKASLTKLLKIMPDYAQDKFEMVRFD